MSGLPHTVDTTLFPEVEPGFMRCALTLMTFFAASIAPAAAQESPAARAEYFAAVARFFALPLTEVAILGEWEIAAQEIPVVLFLARRSGVSPEALVALRDAGQSWATLATRYRVGPAALHVPVSDDAPAGALAGAYDMYRNTPVGRWSSIRLTDEDVVGLVNVRLISQSLDLPAERVLGFTGSVGSYVELYAQLKR
ncbi:MAG: hypothetical protein ACPHQP_04610 [Longimicrobiales bacterium]